MYCFWDFKEKCVKKRTANEESNIHWIIQHENLTDPEITAFAD
ncbi:hypothetical protein RU95_GL003503 [Enterococcus avium]|nr:hypothetical protein RU95_GL003503 [Enterococcus avium]